MKETYTKYKIAQQIIEKNKLKKNKDITIRCSNCNKEITYNGCGSHAKKCNTIFDDKLIAYKQYYECYEDCVICNSNIVIDKKRPDNKNVIREKTHQYVVCSAECKLKLYSFIYHYEHNKKICPICGNEYISLNKKTCSYECGRKLFSNFLVNWHSSNKDEDWYKNMHKGRNNFEDYFKTNDIWNKGLTGQDYLSHYDKEDGTNSLYTAIRNNRKWYKKTKPECKFEEILSDHKLDYRYSVFHGRHQFDFSIRFQDIMIIVEVDGDYWHKSKLSCTDEEERKMCRLEDKLKSAIITKDNNLSNKMGKKWYIVRFWENDINNDTNIVNKYIFRIKQAINNGKKFENIFKEIKEYYEIKS